MIMKSIFLVNFVTVVCFSTTTGLIQNGTLFEGFYEVPENATVQEKWLYYQNITKITANSGLNKLFSYVMQESHNLNITTDCTKNVLKLISGLRNAKVWAFRFLDSSSSWLSGVHYGSMASFGSHEECVDSTVTEGDGGVIFRGQYCAIDLSPALPPKPKVYKTSDALVDIEKILEQNTVVSSLAHRAPIFYFQPFRLGLCVPSGCTMEDVNQALKQLGNSAALDIRAKRCEVKEEGSFTKIQIAVICVYCFTGGILLIATVIDTCSYYKLVICKSISINLLLTFSLLRNFKRLTNTSNEGKFDCLNGIRFLSMSWVVLGHTNAIVNYRMYFDFIRMGQHASGYAYQAVVNAYLAVETFFVMGGFLVCYLTIKLVKVEGRPFSVKLAIFRRLWRLVPVYFYVILFVFLGPLIGSGPLWKETVDEDIQNCYDNWWTNLLFINNVHNSDKMCIRQSWYLACDFQMFVFALFISFILLKNSKVGVFLTFSTVLASIIYSGYVTYLNDYPPTLLSVYVDKQYGREYRSNFFYLPFTHAAPYFIGYLTGYFLAIKPNVRLHSIVQLLGWIFAITCNISVMYGVRPWNAGSEPNLWERLLYASFGRCAWSIGVAWMMYCCCTGHGGIVNYILSLKVFSPLSRLTFLVYLIHPVVLTFFAGSIKTQIQMDHFLMVWLYLGHMCISYAVAFGGNMLLEAPLTSLDKMIFKVRLKNSSTIEVQKAISQEKFEFDKFEVIQVKVNNCENVNTVNPSNVK